MHARLTHKTRTQVPTDARVQVIGYRSLGRRVKWETQRMNLPECDWFSLLLAQNLPVNLGTGSSAQLLYVLNILILWINKMTLDIATQQSYACIFHHKLRASKYFPQQCALQGCDIVSRCRWISSFRSIPLFTSSGLNHG